MIGSQRGKKRGAISRGSFAGVTALAVAVAAILVILGRVAASASMFVAPPPDSSVPGSTPSPSVVVSGTSKGSPSAPVTIILYSDFQCAHCQQFALTTEKQLDKAYIETGKVRLIFKHRVIFGEESMQAAEASECAAEQDKFWPYYDLLMQVQASPRQDDLPTSKLQDLAELAGLDMATFNTSLGSGKYRQKVILDDTQGRALGIEGSPTFFVNGLMIEATPSFKDFQKLIESMLEGAAR